MDTTATLASVEWGTVGEWLGGMSAALGLLFAGLQIRLATQQRRQEEKLRTSAEEIRREAMARSVSVNAYYNNADTKDVLAEYPWAADAPSGVGQDTGESVWLKMEYRLHNGGDLPIDNVVVVVGDPSAPTYRPQAQVGTATEIVIGTLAAKETDEDQRLVRFGAEPVFGELTALAGVLFTDAWENHWYRAPGKLERCEGPPRIC